MNDVNSWPAIIVMITAHLHSQPVRPGFVWNYCSMSSVSSPLSFFRVCFHVLLIIRFSAGLYWITPEAHHWLNDVGSETHNFDKVPSFANRRNVMNLIEIIKGTAPWMVDGIELKFPFWAVFSFLTQEAKPHNTQYYQSLLAPSSLPIIQLDEMFSRSTTHDVH